MKRAGSGKGIRWLASLFALICALLGFTHPAAASNPVSVVVSNIRDMLFVVSWLTPVPETGQVQLVGGATFEDDRGAGYKSLTHYVTVTGLQVNTSYQFDILSGGMRYDDERAHYTVTTGATLVPPTPDLIVGRVKNPDGSDATDAIVIFTVQQEQSISAPMSMLVTSRDGGFFHINLSDARVQKDPTRYFAYGSQTDLLTVQAVGAQGSGALRLPVSDGRLRSANPNQTMTIQLGTGEQTPALVERRPTPTPIPAAPAQERGGLVVGVAMAALVIVGILVIAMLFIWQR